MEEEKPVLQEIEDKKEKWISRISLWVSVLLTTAIVIWYYQSNPPESPEVVRMRVFFKEKNRDVMKFISMDRNEQIAFAFKNKHPFYLSYIRKSTVEQEKIRSLVHVSTDGLMTEACIVLMRRETEARIKNYQKEKEREQHLASDERESPEE